MDAIIVGAGMAGLNCAFHLQRNGLKFLVLETSEGSGGRIRTDEPDRFLLDRGFQVFLTAYPEAQRVLDKKPCHPHPDLKFVMDFFSAEIILRMVL
jgi:phytoene dehydrogenase-like protein